MHGLEVSDYLIHVFHEIMNGHKDRKRFWNNRQFKC